MKPRTAYILGVLTGLVAFWLGLARLERVLVKMLSDEEWNQLFIADESVSDPNGFLPGSNN